MSCPHPKMCAGMTAGCMSPDKCGSERQLAEPNDFDTALERVRPIKPKPAPMNRAERRALKQTANGKHGRRQGPERLTRKGKKRC